MRRIRFTREAVIFLMFLVACLALINEVYEETVAKDKIVYRQWNMLNSHIKNNENINYAVVGDSQAVQAVNPKYLNDSYNMASYGEKYQKNYYKLRHILDKNITIENLLLQVDLHTFSTNYDRDPNWQNDLYLYSHIIPYSKLDEAYDPQFSMNLEANLPVIAHGHEFIHLIDEPHLQEIYKGWVNNTAVMNSSENEIIKLYEDVFVNESRFSNYIYPHFKKTLALAKENDINVILIRYPISPPYRELIDNKGLEIEGYYEKILLDAKKVLGYRPLILNYYPLFNNTRYFADPNHLNHIGAMELTYILKQDIGYINQGQD